MLEKGRLIRKLHKGCEGVVSVLLAVAILPFFSLGAAFIESERYLNSMSALDEALGSSAISTLAQYDSYLLQRFGLLAVKQTNDDDFIEKQIENYLKKQKTLDLYGAGSANATIGASGIYPLADTEILRRQVMSYSNLLVPAKMTTDFIIEDLVKQLEKILIPESVQKLIAFTDSASNTVSKEVTMLEKIEDAQDDLNTLSNNISTYNTKYNAFNDAMIHVYEHLQTEKPDAEEDPDGAQTWENTLKELRDAAELAKTEYITAIDSVSKSLDSFEKSLRSARGAINEFEGSLLTTTTSGVSAYMQKETDDYLNSLTEDEKKAQKDMTTTVTKQLSTLEDAFGKTGKSVIQKATEAVNQFSPAGMLNASRALLNDVKPSVEAAKTDDGYMAENRSQYFYSLEEYKDRGEISGMLTEMEQGAEKENGLKMLLALFDLLGEIFNTKTFFDPSLNVTLESSYYNTLPGTKGGEGNVHVFQSPYESEDETHSKRIKAMIDPDYSESDPFGLFTTRNKINALKQAVEDLMEKKEAMKNSRWILPKLRAFGECVKQCVTVLKALIDFILHIVSIIKRAIYQHNLMAGYMAYNLPNRTNYKTGKTMTGFSYSGAGLAPSLVGTNIPRIGELIAMTTTNTNKSFSGAELEYVMTGNRSEMANQVSVFWSLWAFRLALDVIPIAMNEGVQALVNTISAIPIVGPIMATIYLVCVILIEPYFDTFFLVNGGGIKLLKLEQSDVFLQPTGIPGLIDKMWSIPMSNATKTSMAKELCESVGMTYSEPTKPEGSFEKWEEGSLNSINEMNYTQHLIFLMVLFMNETTYLNRLANIIQMECNYRSTDPSNTSLSQRATGQYTEFNLEKAFTSIRISAEGTLKQIMPVPSVFNSGSSGNGVFDSPFHYNRVLYRGY